MAKFEFRLPDIGEGVMEGEIVAWGDGVSVGAHVEAEQTLAEVMTDKATVTLPSPKSGTIVSLGGSVGDVLAVGAVLLEIETEEAASKTDQQPDQQPAPSSPEPVSKTPQAPPPTKQPNAGASAGPTASAAGSIPEALPGMVPSVSSNSGKQGARPLAAPATRKLARELGVSLQDVPGSGPHGRITREDVRKIGEASRSATSTDITTVPSQGSSSSAYLPMHIVTPAAAGRQLEERIPLRGVRKKIFEQMSRSMHTAAHFTFVEECDVTALEALRSRLRPLADGQGVKLSFLPFILKACVAALKRHPILNAAYDESTEEIVLRKYYDIGVAAATDSGLMVPVVREADAKSILEIARDIARLAKGAQEGKIRREDLVGSTFTITSLGAVGGLFATPILNFPEVAILGVHQIKEKPVVRDGQIVVGKVMLLSLSFDHRIIDGHIGAAFAYEVIRYLENPDKLMLEMA